jgi:hypothetical protein
MKRLEPRQNKFHAGAGADGKHYWLTPPAVYAELDKEFAFTFDPCPFPKPDDFDGLTCEWGSSNYVNPPFGSIMHEGRRKGATFWARKAIAEAQKGKRVVLVYPLDKWVLMMIKAGAEIRNLGDLRWRAIEDNTPGPGTGRHIAAFILNGKNKETKMPTIRFEITGDSIAEIQDTLQTMVPIKTREHMLAEMSLEALLLYADERCQAEGYEMLVTKQEEREKPKKVEARSKLFQDLKTSVEAIEAKKGNGKSTVETDDERKARCVARLQELFAEGHKTEVRALLKQYGDGAKNFHGVPVERFAEISQAIEELKL